MSNITKLTTKNQIILQKNITFIYNYNKPWSIFNVGVGYTTVGKVEVNKIILKTKKKKLNVHTSMAL